MTAAESRDSRSVPSENAAGIHRSFDVCLIMPTREEFDYARDLLQFGSPISDDSYFLYPFTVPGSAITGAAVVLFEMGLAAAAVAATRLLAVYDIGVLALVGIAGALDPALQLGDVVIASSVDEYLYRAKARPAPAGSGVEFELGGVSWQATREIVNFTNNFRYLQETVPGFASWRERARKRRDPGLAAAIPSHARDYPDYFVGAIATGEIVSASEAFARWLRQTNRSRIAIEMEAGGAARAIYRHGAQLIVVRGISDRSDERKHEIDNTVGQDLDSGAWRRYAMHNAIDLLAVLLANPHFPWPNAAYSPDSDSRDRRSEPRDRGESGTNARPSVAQEFGTVIAPGSVFGIAYGTRGGELCQKIKNRSRRLPMVPPRTNVKLLRMPARWMTASTMVGGPMPVT